MYLLTDKEDEKSISFDSRFVELENTGAYWTYEYYTLHLSSQPNPMLPQTNMVPLANHSCLTSSQNYIPLVLDWESSLLGANLTLNCRVNAKIVGEWGVVEALIIFLSETTSLIAAIPPTLDYPFTYCILEIQSLLVSLCTNHHKRFIALYEFSQLVP